MSEEAKFDGFTISRDYEWKAAHECQRILITFATFSTRRGHPFYISPSYLNFVKLIILSHNIDSKKLRNISE